jgi:hypothetical protein
MTMVSLTDGCRLLTIDPKTLHRWMSLSHLSAQPHPLDARLKCVTLEQVQQVAVTHRRTLPESSEQHFQPETSAPSTPSDVIRASVVSSVVSAVSVHITALTQQLGSLQAHVATLHHQLALLTEQVQQEQQWRTSVTKMFMDTSQESSLDTSQESSLDTSQESSLDKEPALPSPSIDRRKHPHVLPLVEYGAQGKYVMSSPEQGLLSFEPDSPQWFAWLSTLPSVRFVGQPGRFTAFRGYQCSESTPWWAHRQIRNHSHKRRLGTTASVTIASLELAASSLQALV